MAEEYKRMRQMVGSPSDWAGNTLVMGDGEIAFERDGSTISAKLGDGVLPFDSLPYFTQSLWQSSGSYTYSRMDGPVVVGATSGPDRLTVRGGNFTVGVYREEIPTAGQHLGIVKFGALEGTAAPAEGGHIRGEATESWSPTAHGSRLRFTITPDGTIVDVSAGTIENDGGLVWGSPTGGSMGAGTLNVEALYIDGVPVVP